MRSKLFWLITLTALCSVSIIAGRWAGARSRNSSEVAPIIIVGDAWQTHDLSDRKQVVEATYQIQNQTRRDVKIHGIGTNCSCMKVKFDPILLHSGESRSFNLKFPGM